MKEPKTLTIGIELEGYEEIKKQLTDIENQLDRINEKNGSMNDEKIIICCPKCHRALIKKRNGYHICLEKSKINEHFNALLLECECGAKNIVDMRSL
ncbi:MAG: hypothetical protein KH415_18520 [Clostridium sp.]|nr:hypothetical protein [Clostridium sp.]